MVLQLDITDLNAYVDLLNCRTSRDNTFKLTADDTFYKVCQKHLLTNVNRVRFFRCLTVYRFFSQLAKHGIIDPVKVKLHPFKKGCAYMLDRGEVHLMSDLLIKSGYRDFVAVLLHESAHIVLSQTENYKSLLELDLQFAQKYLKNQHKELLKVVTPVEFFAQLITAEWFLLLAENTDNPKAEEILLNESQKIQSKLDSAVELFNKINCL